MPGAYTHLTHARELVGGNSLENMNLPAAAKAALRGYPEFCRMGAISPDFPYLKLFGKSEDAEHWANAMHHKYGTLTRNNILHVGVDYIKKLIGDEQGKCLSWFLGYASHIVADVTCHPVTNLLVGDYEADNKKAHRESEMHQDVYIYNKRDDGDVHNSEVIKNVVGLCTDSDNNFDSEIEKFWTHLLTKSFPQLADKFVIDIPGWHRAFQFFISKFAEELSILPSRHIRDFFSEEGIMYPRLDEIDLEKYINKLRTPKNRTKNYDQIFDLAHTKIKKVWTLLSRGIFLDDDAYKEKVGIWNLDTGQEVNTQKVMWEKIV